eukprot:3733804-Rhodomonas_salina.3
MSSSPWSHHTRSQQRAWRGARAALHQRQARRRQGEGNPLGAEARSPSAGTDTSASSRAGSCSPHVSSGHAGALPASLAHFP